MTIVLMLQQIDRLVSENRTDMAKPTKADKAMEKLASWSKLEVKAGEDHPSIPTLRKLVQEASQTYKAMECIEQYKVLQKFEDSLHYKFEEANHPAMMVGSDEDAWGLRSLRYVVDDDTDALISAEAVTKSSLILAIRDILKMSTVVDSQEQLAKLDDYTSCKGIEGSRWRYHLKNSFAQWKKKHNTAKDKFGASPEHTMKSLRTLLA